MVTVKPLFNSALQIFFSEWKRDMSWVVLWKVVKLYCLWNKASWLYPRSNDKFREETTAKHILLKCFRVWFHLILNWDFLKTSWFGRGKIALTLKRNPIIRHITTYLPWEKLYCQRMIKAPPRGLCLSGTASLRRASC